MARSQAAARPDARSVGGVIVRSRGFALINARAEHLKPLPRMMFSVVKC